jgi:hypothetical protein
VIIMHISHILRPVRFAAGAIQRRRTEKKLRESINLSQGFEIEKVRRKTLSYVESMRIKGTEYGKYRYCESVKEPVLYASVYAALTRHLYNDLAGLNEKEKAEWAEYIRSHQSNDGLFRDPQVENKAAETCDWWGWRHMTLHALMALTCLDSKAEKDFKIIELCDLPSVFKGFPEKRVGRRHNPVDVRLAG